MKKVSWAEWKKIIGWIFWAWCCDINNVCISKQKQLNNSVSQITRGHPSYNHLSVKRTRYRNLFFPSACFCTWQAEEATCQKFIVEGRPPLSDYTIISARATHLWRRDYQWQYCIPLSSFPSYAGLFVLLLKTKNHRCMHMPMNPLSADPSFYSAGWNQFNLWFNGLIVSHKRKLLFPFNCRVKSDIIQLQHYSIQYNK